MRNESTLESNYFDWLYSLVVYDQYTLKRSFKTLLTYLFDTPFIAIVYLDKNRICDGLYLREHFISDYNYDDYALDELNRVKPCSVLEVMIGLANRCATTILDGEDYGLYDMFWGMIDNLGLLGMHDDNFNLDQVEDIVHTFINREYEPNGKGGLFTVHRQEDLRNVDIWYQMMWYLSELFEGDNI